MIADRLFDDADDNEEGETPGSIFKLTRPANDNEPHPERPLTRQVVMTPYLHIGHLGSFQSEDLSKFIDYYLLPGGKLPKHGALVHLTDDDGEDVWAAVIPEKDKRIGEPWGVETYRTEREAEFALRVGLLEVESE